MLFVLFLAITPLIAAPTAAQSTEPALTPDWRMDALLASRLHSPPELLWTPKAPPKPAPHRPTVPEPEDYHPAPYFGPVPATLAGATVVDYAQARQLHDQGVAFLDVLPRVVRPDDIPVGTIWVEPQHMTIPGAIWLADTGYETLTTPQMAAFRQGLAQASQGDPDGQMVFFCTADCWMSWNAAKRAVEMGYTSVIWFPEGTDGWQEGGGELAPAMPDGP